MQGENAQYQNLTPFSQREDTAGEGLQGIDRTHVNVHVVYLCVYAFVSFSLIVCLLCWSGGFRLCLLNVRLQLQFQGRLNEDGKNLSFLLFPLYERTSSAKKGMTTRLVNSQNFLSISSRRGEASRSFLSDERKSKTILFLNISPPFINFIFQSATASGQEYVIIESEH